MKSWDVIVVGEIYIDHVFTGFEAWPNPGEEVFTEDYAREVGGGAVTTACGLARLGKSVNLLGVIGQDDAPWIGLRLAEFGVTGQGLRKVPGTTGVTLSVSTREDRSFFTHIGANRHLGQRLLSPDTLTWLLAARHVHFAMPLSRNAAAIILPMLSEAGCTSSLDVGYQPAWLQDETHSTTWQAVDYLLPNEKEAALLSGGTTPEDYLSFARELRMRTGIVKLGARGAMGIANGRMISVRPPTVAAVDTTGSGDAFDAGFIDALLEGAALEDCLRRACICGALSTRVPGALGALPHREELWSVYDKTYRS